MIVSLFTTSNWAISSYAERLEALQSLENYFADMQGRTRRTVQAVDLKEGVMGKYNPSVPTNIFISQQLLNDNTGNFEAMDTIVHEGRHAYQDDCIMWRCAPNSADVVRLNGWRENMPRRGGKGGNYLDDGGYAYRYQPVEADAYCYAGIHMDAYRNYFGDDPNYIAYVTKREAADNRLEGKAKMALGDNYRERIAKDVSEGYRQLCIAGLGISADGGSFGNGGSGMAISTAELVAKIRGLQSSSEQLSAVVANASQDLIRQANVLAQLTRGSRSGEEATNVVRTSSQSLNRAASTLKSLCQAGDEYIQNAVK